MVEGSVSAVGPTTIVALVATDCATGQTDQPRSGRGPAEGGGPARRRHARVVDPLRRLVSPTRLGRPAQRADRGSDHAVARGAEGVSRRACRAARRATRSNRSSYFERAITLDPGFALAYTTLSSLYGGLGETGRGEEYARRAYEHRETVSERERLFITYQYHDRVTGDQLKTREALEVWKQAYPRDYRPPNALAVLLNRLGDYDARDCRSARRRCRRNPPTRFPIRTSPTRFAAPAATTKPRQSPTERCEMGSKRCRRAACCISSPSCADDDAARAGPARLGAAAVAWIRSDRRARAGRGVSADGWLMRASSTSRR